MQRCFYFLICLCLGWVIGSSSGCKKSSKIARLSSSQQIEALTQSENLIQTLAQPMSELHLFFKQRSTSLDQVFADDPVCLGIADFDLENAIASASGSSDTGELISQITVPVQSAGAADRLSKTAASKIAPTELWKQILSWNDQSPVNFDDCQFGTIGSRFLENSDFEVNTKFEGRFRGPHNQVIGVHAKQTLQWTLVEPDQWRIKRWTQTAMKLVTCRDSLFQDVTATAIPDRATLKSLQRSVHQEKLLQSANTRSHELKNIKKEYKNFDDWESAFQYPSVSVVDLDQDGHDDLFVTARWQPGMLLRNNGDGTFIDVTAESGLAVEDLACCALFADFDNDGDSDVFVGRTLQPSQYFENVDGRFGLVDKYSAEFEYIRFVVSGSVVDVNGDGLLDLYLNTYGFSMEESAWSDGSFREQDIAPMRHKVESQDWFVDRAGAPNILLMNEGGTLKRVEIDDTLSQWRNSYQSSWSDFDEDGDQDLYICNDFAPDYFLRNDTPRGSFSPKFVDVTSEKVPGGTMGFGMGASWGDFNNDAMLDLYVSNMYSKAGNRIMSQLTDVDPRIEVSAQGNFLFENLGDSFRQVAGHDDHSQAVAQVGWSFGGQFADFDNDGNLDLYVPSGYYTPPKSIQLPGDL